MESIKSEFEKIVFSCEKALFLIAWIIFFDWLTAGKEATGSLEQAPEASLWKTFSYIKTRFDASERVFLQENAFS